MPVQTRSQTKPTTYEVNIDFDGASAAWKANKKQASIPATYTYICFGKNCKWDAQPGINYCKHHSNQAHK